MSFGLQVFSATGKALIDTSFGSLLIKDIITLPVNLSWTKTYPELSGQSVEAMLLIPVLTASSPAVPNIAIDYPSGEPRVTSSYVSGTTGGVWTLIVIARPTNAAVNTFGIQVVSELDNAQVISAGTKKLKYMGYTYGENAPNGGWDQVYLTGGASPIIPVSTLQPVIFLEMSSSHKTMIAYFDDISGAQNGSAWVASIYSDIGFRPKMYVFLPIENNAEIVADQYGLAIYDQSGNIAFHSGQDVKLLHTVGFESISPPPQWSSKIHTPVKPLPLSCACSYISHKGYAAGTGRYYNTIKLNNDGSITEQWILDPQTGSPITMSQPRVTAFINTAFYN